MDSRSTAAADTTSYPASPWPASSYTTQIPIVAQYYYPAASLPLNHEQAVFLAQQQSLGVFNPYRDALQHYNSLVAPGRGGGITSHQHQHQHQHQNQHQHQHQHQYQHQNPHQQSLQFHQTASSAVQQTQSAAPGQAQLRSNPSFSVLSQVVSNKQQPQSQQTSVTSSVTSPTSLSPLPSSSATVLSKTTTSRSRSNSKASTTISTAITLVDSPASSETSLSGLSVGSSQKENIAVALKGNKGPSGHVNKGSTGISTSTITSSTPLATISPISRNISQPQSSSASRDTKLVDRSRNKTAAAPTSTTVTETDSHNKKVASDSSIPVTHNAVVPKEAKLTAALAKMPSKGQSSNNAASSATSSSTTVTATATSSSASRAHVNSKTSTSQNAVSSTTAAKTTGGGRQTPSHEKSSNTNNYHELAPPRTTALSTRPSHLQNQSNTHSNSVPSTPHQHGRNFSFESRDPSPNATGGHSPRSSYSETNSSLPSLRPLPPATNTCPYETSKFHFRRRIPYSRGSDPLEKIDLDKVKSELTPEEDKHLTEAIHKLYAELLPKPENEVRRTKLVAKLERLFNEEWPGHDIKVHLFGSSGNMLCSDNSDVDICITTSWKEMEDVCKIADLLAKRGMEKVVCISAAKVPIVKIWDPELSLACDMNVNNTLALDNTRMVRTYVELDERVRPLAMAIKHWTRRRVINDAALGGTLSSYTWICLIIGFLQLRDPPVVPVLHQKKYPRLPRKAGQPESPFADDVAKMRGFGKNNKSSVGSLLFQFFRFYGHEFDYSKNVISVRQGSLTLSKKSKGWHHSINNSLCVEEPFNTDRNLGNTADEYSFCGLHEELRRAFDLISEGKFDECCEQFEFPKEEDRPTFTRPAPRPAILRMSSQSHSGRGRGGHNGRGRHGGMRNGNSNRRSSNATYDQSQQYMQQQQPQMPAQYQNMVVSPEQALDCQTSGILYPMYWVIQPSMSLGQVTGQPQTASQSQQSQVSTQPPVAAGQSQPGQPIQPPQQPHHRLQTAAAVISGDRSKTNLVDASPMIPIPNIHLGQAYPYIYGQQYISTTQSITSNPMGATTMEPLRRGPHRSHNQERSHSQPASRTATSQTPMGGPANSRHEEISNHGAGELYMDDAGHSVMAHGAMAPMVTEGGTMAPPATMQHPAPTRRSAEVLSAAERRMRPEPSRSPSPLGIHHRTLSGNASMSSLPPVISNMQQYPRLQRPATVVSGAGSGLKTSTSVSQEPPIQTPISVSAACHPEDPDPIPTPMGLGIRNHGSNHGSTGSVASTPAEVYTPPMAGSPARTPSSAPPLVVNGTFQRPLHLMLAEQKASAMNQFRAQYYPPVPGFEYAHPFYAHSSLISAEMSYAAYVQHVQQQQHQFQQQQHQMQPPTSAPMTAHSGRASSTSQPQQDSTVPTTASQVGTATAAASTTQSQAASQALSPVYEDKLPVLGSASNVIAVPAKAASSGTASKRLENPAGLSAAEVVAASLKNADDAAPVKNDESATKKSGNNAGSNSDHKSGSRGHGNGNNKQNGNSGGGQNQASAKISGRKGRGSSNDTSESRDSHAPQFHEKNGESLSNRMAGHSHNNADSGRWQKPKSRKKGGSSADRHHGSNGVSSNAEAPPRDESERKGG